MPSLALTVTHCKNVEIQGHSGNDMQQQRVFGFCDKTCKVAFMVHAIKLSPEIGLPKRGRHLWSGRCYRSTTPFILPRTRMPPPPHCGKATSWSVPSHCRGMITLRHTTHAARLSWMGDHPDAATRSRDIHAVEIRTRNPSTRTAADPPLRTCGQWDRRPSFYST